MAMTPRQWALYRLLLSRSVLNWDSSQRDIYECYPDSIHEDGYHFVDNPKHGDHIRELWDDVQAINSTDEVDKIIVVKDYSYKLGTPEECSSEFSKLFRKHQESLKRALAILSKMRKDGQGKLLSNAMKEIKEDSSAKLFIESFPNE
jgi:hypothetical protein